MVAEINDQHSSHSARARVDTHASSGWSVEDIRPMYAACIMERATTLEKSVCKHLSVGALKNGSPESKRERCNYLHFQVEGKSQWPDNH